METSKDPWEDFDVGEVHIRDRYQFELRSEFFQKSLPFKSKYVQEFYLFIPDSLQINASNYSKEQFYSDQTNFIRYKTPRFSFNELFDLSNSTSPITRLLSFPKEVTEQTDYERIEDEIKLLANVIKSALHGEVKAILIEIETAQPKVDTTNLLRWMKELCHHLDHAYLIYEEIKSKFLNSETAVSSLKPRPFSFNQQITYTEEFINEVVSHDLIKILENIRLKHQKNLSEIDDTLCTFLLKRKFSKAKSDLHKINKIEGENLLYKSSLLNRFILDALQLSTNRFSTDKQFAYLTSSLSAGIAMLIYFSLYAWLGGVFVINSAPFILLTVVTYVLKGQIEGWLRTASYEQASKLFSDYTTVIRSLDKKHDLGTVQEFFTFIQGERVSEELKEIRNTGSHTILEGFKRPEKVLFYKRIIKITPTRYSDGTYNTRRHGFNVIFRFNIHQFLYKANDPVETHLVLDPTTRKLLHIHLPKVYHLNLIIKTTDASVPATFFKKKELPTPRIEFTTLRLIIDKNGIKRIEQLSRWQSKEPIS